MDEDGGKPKTLTWDQAQAKIKERYEHTETIVFDFGDGSEVKFVVRGLTPQEYERFEKHVSKMVERKQLDAKKYRNINFRNVRKDEDEDEVVTYAAHYFIRHGIVESPEGFKPDDKTLSELPPILKSSLADTIDGLTNLGIEVKDGFR